MPGFYEQLYIAFQEGLSDDEIKCLVEVFLMKAFFFLDGMLFHGIHQRTYFKYSTAEEDSYILSNPQAVAYTRILDPLLHRPENVQCLLVIRQIDFSGIKNDKVKLRACINDVSGP